VVDVRLTPAPPVADWQPSAADWAELGPQAVALLDATVGAFRFDPVEGPQLLIALRSLSRAEHLELIIGAQLTDAHGKPSRLLGALARELRE
jgi:hypothetical protein